MVLKLCAERDAMATVYGQITIGTLVTQDVLVGVLFALLPVLGGSGDVQGGFAAMAGLALRMALFLAGALLLSRRAVGPFLRALQLISGRSGGEELFQMVVVAFCLVVAWASDALGLSIEMGAFVAGTMISSTEHAQRTLHHVEPIRNLFAAMFLASIGMVINPSFLWLHLDILLVRAGRRSPRRRRPPPAKGRRGQRRDAAVLTRTPSPLASRVQPPRVPPRHPHPPTHPPKKS